MDPNHIATMAQRAMQHGDYPQALNYLNMGLAHLPPSVPQYAARFLSDRAECFWQLGNAQAAIHDMRDAIGVGLPSYGLHSEVTVYHNKFVLSWYSFVNLKIF